MRSSRWSNEARQNQPRVRPIPTAGGRGWRRLFGPWSSVPCSNYAPLVENVNPPVEPNYGSNPIMESLQRLLARNLRAFKDRRGMVEGDLVLLGVPAGSAHRAIQKEGQNVRLDTLEKWAVALRAAAWELLHPHYDPDNKLLAYNEAEIEAEVERRVKERLQTILDGMGKDDASNESANRPVYFDPKKHRK